jgi:5-bromo-4-chloroindolyl phosphate hydrolysis protein
MKKCLVVVFLGLVIIGAFMLHWILGLIVLLGIIILSMSARED